MSYMQVDWTEWIGALWDFRPVLKTAAEIKRAGGGKGLSAFTDMLSMKVDLMKRYIPTSHNIKVLQQFIARCRYVRNVGAFGTYAFSTLFWGEVYYQVAIRGFCSVYCGEKECGLHMELPF